MSDQPEVTDVQPILAVETVEPEPVADEPIALTAQPTESAQTPEEAEAGEKHELLAWVKAEMLKIEGWPESVWRRVEGVLDTAKSNVTSKESQ